MSNDILLTLVEQYKEAAQLIEAAQAEQEALRAQIKEALAERSTSYLEIGCHKVRLSDFSSTRLDSKGPGSSQTGAPKPPKAKSSTRRWICPKCGTIIRSTKEVRVICADCMELFVKAD